MSSSDPIETRAPRYVVRFLAEGRPGKRPFTRRRDITVTLEADNEDEARAIVKREYTVATIHWIRTA